MLERKNSRSIEQSFRKSPSRMSFIKRESLPTLGSHNQVLKWENVRGEITAMMSDGSPEGRETGPSVLEDKKGF